MESEIASNVIAFLDKASELNGKIQADRFSQQMYGDCLEKEMQSPIEHLFWIAVNLQAGAESWEVNPPPVGPDANGNFKFSGLQITPQTRIGNYKVDFCIQVYGIGPAEFFGPVVVELDGHAFHDKDKRQRAYEKARDRYLVKAGYRVLHFTGSEVVADPFKVAYEALDLVGIFYATERAYDAADPLGLGERL